MDYSSTRPLRAAYVLVVLSIILPLGIFSSGWVALAMGGGWSPAMTVPFLAMFAIGAYRIYLVVRIPSTLSSSGIAGVAKVLRVIGLLGLYFGAAVIILSLFTSPLMKMLVKQRSDSGVEYFVVGLYLTMLRGVGILGLLSFEFSRLLGFERQLLEQSIRRAE